MPFASSGKIYKCKYWDSPAKKNLSSGRHKGYYQTCGSKECLGKPYKDPIVNDKKRCSKLSICEHCNKPYTRTSFRQKWCAECVPNERFRAIMRRYKISYTEFNKMLSLIKGICPICLKREATMVDHDHSTGKVRGIICSHCNTAPHLVEDEDALLRAKDYLNVHK